MDGVSLSKESCRFVEKESSLDSLLWSPKGFIKALPVVLYL